MIGEILVSLLLVLGGGFGLVGAWGLVRLPDAMSRLHAPTKSATLGVGAVLLASLIWFPSQGLGQDWHELLITLFLLLTAPVTGLMLARANIASARRRGEAGPPGGDWSALAADPPPADDRQP
ncbi:Na+/H+ antiporter subunit G [Paracoccus limosus]|uniref:Na+/H+ antiporter subunit G n=1 Tax=Paracoccus limosus TaxID=913252 RepID=A0A844H8G1_9RHOB|nr:Na+/H+ antiporter subunit G [Paracoccus limosus]MTH35840.1 Na+/H+ antiporter subunit G [Paracoccus limosus]